MRKAIITLLLAICSMSTWAQKISDFSTTTNVSTNDYMAGVRWDGVSFTNKKYQLPFRYQDGVYKVPSVHDGVVVADTDGTQTGVPFDTLFTHMYRGYWDSIVVFTSAANGGVYGNLYYKIDRIGGYLVMRGTLSANNAQNFAALPGSGFKIMGTLPISLAVPAYFSAYFYGAGAFKDDAGVDWIRQLNCYVAQDGTIKMCWLRPEVAISAYTIYVNAVIPL